MVGALSKFPLAAATSGNRLSSILLPISYEVPKDKFSRSLLFLRAFTDLDDHKCHNFAISQRCCWSYKAEHLSSRLDGNWLRQKLTRDACALPALRRFPTFHPMCITLYQSQHQYIPGCIYSCAYIFDWNSYTRISNYCLIDWSTEVDLAFEFSIFWLLLLLLPLLGGWNRLETTYQ